MLLHLSGFQFPDILLAVFEEWDKTLPQPPPFHALGRMDCGVRWDMSGKRAGKVALDAGKRGL